MMSLLSFDSKNKYTRSDVFCCFGAMENFHDSRIKTHKWSSSTLEYLINDHVRLLGLEFSSSVVALFPVWSFIFKSLFLVCSFITSCSFITMLKIIHQFEFHLVSRYFNMIPLYWTNCLQFWNCWCPFWCWCPLIS